jgi:hypothetical protein
MAGLEPAAWALQVPRTSACASSANGDRKSRTPGLTFRRGALSPSELYPRNLELQRALQAIPLAVRLTDFLTAMHGD